MAVMQWKDSFSVGIEKFDRQHKQLVDMINDVSEVIVNKKDNSELLNVVNKLDNYVQMHFRDEEAEFDRVNYKFSSDHKQEHSNFAIKVEALKKDLAAGKTFVALKLSNFLKDWVINHITDSDKKYSDALKS